MLPSPGPVCSSWDPFLACSHSLFAHRELTLQVAFLSFWAAGFCLGLVNGMYQWEIGRWEKGRGRGRSISLHPSQPQAPAFLQLSPKKPLQLQSPQVPQPRSSWTSTSSLCPTVPQKACLRRHHTDLQVTSPSSIWLFNLSITQVTTSLSLIPSAVDT